MDTDYKLPNRTLLSRNAFKDLEKKHSVFSNLSYRTPRVSDENSTYSIGTLFSVTPILGISNSHSEHLRSQGLQEKNASGTTIKAQIIEKNRWKGPYSIFRGCAVNYIQTVDIPLSERYQLGLSLSAYNPRNPIVQNIGASGLYVTDSNVILKV